MMAQRTMRVENTVLLNVLNVCNGSVPVGSFRPCCVPLLALEEFPEIEIEPDLIPEIHLDPPAAA